MPDSAKGSPAPGSLQALQLALQRALLRCPGQAEPPELQALLLLPLPPPRKLSLVRGRELLRDNLAWDPPGPPRGLEQLRTALSVLEKYGRNLLGPRRPPRWRALSFGNPVYRATVGAIRGGRAVLQLLGYTEESGEGLSFPRAPLPPRVAAVTADVLVLRAELERLLRNQHPNPQFFTDILLGDDELPLPSDAGELLPAGDPTPPWACPGSGRGWRCRSCSLFNPAPAVLCGACERPRLAPALGASPAPALPGPAPWPCPRCTFLNPGPAPSCHMCDFDHAPAEDVTSGSGHAAATSCSSSASSSAVPETSGLESGTSGIGHALSGATTATSGLGSASSCMVPVTSGLESGTSGFGHALSAASMTTSGSASAPSGVSTTSGCGPAPSADVTTTSGAGSASSCLLPATSGSGEGTSGGGPAPSRDAQRQRKLLEDGRRLVELIRAAESQGLPPDALGPSPLSELPEGSGPAQRVRRFRLRLRAALRELRGAGPQPEVGVASSEPGAFSLAEAAWAWLEGEGRPQEARRALIGRRRRQLRLLSSLGCPSPGPLLLRHRGNVGRARRELQRRRLRPFLSRHFRGAEPALDFGRDDQQALVRQVLATLPVASWGRALLVAGLARELGLGAVAAPSSDPLLGELVEAVGACGERAALRRRLRCDCTVCGAAVPRQKAQWLPGCSCPLCPDCFRLHFSVGLRERGVGALGCPGCGRPDLSDDAQRLCYWSVLEPQLRRCLDPGTFALLTQKLTELELQRDPRFLWCPLCSCGFIFEGERGPAQCPQCHQSCPLPWDPGTGGESGTGAAPALREFLEEPRIRCPSCGQRFALARGGCLHCRCSRCQHQFCAGCGRQFHPPGRCPVPGCRLRGSLHGHHPRLCLFYLRDWEPTQLQHLLTSENVAFETEPLPDAPATGLCPVLEQKELGLALRDEPCGREAPPGHAGLCRIHYTEYLVWLLHSQRPLPEGRGPGQSEAEGAGHQPGTRPPAPNMGRGRGQTGMREN